MKNSRQTLIKLWPPGYGEATVWVIYTCIMMQVSSGSADASDTSGATLGNQSYTYLYREKLWKEKKILDDYSY
jgi:hypothetical protein